MFGITEFINGMDQNQKYLSMFYILLIVLLLITQYSISNQEKNLTELKEFHTEVWEF